MQRIHCKTIFFLVSNTTLASDNPLHPLLTQPMYQHLSNCSAFNDHIMLFTLPDAATNTTIFNKEFHLYNLVINNVEILNNKWGQLQFLEGYYMKKLAPEINFSLKVVSATFLLVCFFMSKRKNLWNKEECFLFHLESSFRSSDNQIWTFQIFKCHDIIKCPSTKHETHFTE